MGSHQPIRKTVTPEIPDKLYFRIGDVARLCEVPAYVLRFWETEFPQLKPNKGGTGQRLYRKRDVEMALRIKSLLYDQGYTIPGARQVFKNDAKAREAATPAFETGPVIAPDFGAPAASLVASRETAGNARIEARLRALREEMQALAAMLGMPSAEAATVPPKVKPMRPRLVTQAEPKSRPPAAKPEVSRLQVAQRDLFGSDGPDAAE
jgi:DNA-binding transcriptional MerR regulator